MGVFHWILAVYLLRGGVSFFYFSFYNVLLWAISGFLVISNNNKNVAPLWMCECVPSNYTRYFVLFCFLHLHVIIACEWQLKPWHRRGKNTIICKQLVRFGHINLWMKMNEKYNKNRRKVNSTIIYWVSWIVLLFSLTWSRVYVFMWFKTLPYVWVLWYLVFQRLSYKSAQSLFNS